MSNFIVPGEPILIRLRRTAKDTSNRSIKLKIPLSEERVIKAFIEGALTERNRCFRELSQYKCEVSEIEYVPWKVVQSLLRDYPLSARQHVFRGRASQKRKLLKEKPNVE